VYVEIRLREGAQERLGERWTGRGDRRLGGLHPSY